MVENSSSFPTSKLFHFFSAGAGTGLILGGMPWMLLQTLWSIAGPKTILFYDPDSPVCCMNTHPWPVNNDALATLVSPPTMHLCFHRRLGPFCCPMEDITMDCHWVEVVEVLQGWHFTDLGAKPLYFLTLVFILTLTLFVLLKTMPTMMHWQN